MSPKAARLAAKQGYRNIRVYLAGMPDWKKNRQLVVVEPADVEGWLDPHHVILDVRPLRASRDGHIRSALSMPLATLKSMDAQFRTSKAAWAKRGLPGLVDRTAPVVVYGADTYSPEAMAAYGILRGWGFKATAALVGGYQGWQTAGRPTATGSTPAKIAYVKKLAKGAVAPAEFTRLVQSGDAAVLDVRSRGEHARGVIPNAITLPLDELEDQLAKVPRDAKVLIHCLTGSRAAIAYNLLKSQGFSNVSYLNERITVRKDGTFCINCG